MENYSNLKSSSFVVEHKQQYNDYVMSEYRFKFFGSNHYANVERINGKYAVVFDRDIYEFDTLENAICFSLGGSFVDSYTSEGYQRKIDDLIETDVITKQQHQQMMQGAKSLLAIWS